eukprot:m.175607 g.175607  ORF g.175607 m.175607 type:complete len:133 (-) comp31828_c0_seq4:2071-2469(-)
MAPPSLSTLVDNVAITIVTTSANNGVDKDIIAILDVNIGAIIVLNTVDNTIATNIACSVVIYVDFAVVNTGPTTSPTSLVAIAFVASLATLSPSRCQRRHHYCCWHRCHSRGHICCLHHRHHLVDTVVPPSV